MGRRRPARLDREGLRNPVRGSGTRIVRGGHLQVALREQPAALGRRRHAVDDLDRRARESDLGDETVMRSGKRLPDRNAVDDVAGVVDVEIAAEIGPLRIAGRDGDGLIVRPRTRAAALREFWIVGVAEIGLLAGREEGDGVVVGRSLRPDRVAARRLAGIGGDRIPPGVGGLGPPQTEEYPHVRRARRPRDSLQPDAGDGEAVVGVLDAADGRERRYRGISVELTGLPGDHPTAGREGVRRSLRREVLVEINQQRLDIFIGAGRVERPGGGVLDE